MKITIMKNGRRLLEVMQMNLVGNMEICFLQFVLLQQED